MLMYFSIRNLSLIVQINDFQFCMFQKSVDAFTSHTIQKCMFQTSQTMKKLIYLYMIFSSWRKSTYFQQLFIFIIFKKVIYFWHHHTFLKNLFFFIFFTLLLRSFCWSFFFNLTIFFHFNKKCFNKIFTYVMS